MKFDNDILNELQTLSPLLAGMQKRNIFSVPDGYFETLSETVLICLKEEAGIINSTKVADVPERYFEHLASSILDKIKAQQNNTTTNQLTEPSALLQSVQQINIFKVPGGYFDNLSSVILDKIKDQQNNSETNTSTELSALLQSVQGKNVFEVPMGYFNEIPANVLQLVKVAPAKVVKMPARRLFFKYAAAAVITGALALGVYKYTDRPSAKAVVPAVSFAKLDSSIEKGKVMNEQQFNEALNTLTKEDITNYLEKNVSEEDISLLTPDVDENDLPSKDDYLLDENALENYLNKIKFQN